MLSDPLLMGDERQSTLVRFGNRPAVTSQEHLDCLNGLPFRETNANLRAFLIRIDILDCGGQPAVEIVENFRETRGLGRAQLLGKWWNIVIEGAPGWSAVWSYRSVARPNCYPAGCRSQFLGTDGLSLGSPIRGDSRCPAGGNFLHRAE